MNVQIPAAASLPSALPAALTKTAGRPGTLLPGAVATPPESPFATLLQNVLGQQQPEEQPEEPAQTAAKTTPEPEKSSVAKQLAALLPQPASLPTVLAKPATQRVVVKQAEAVQPVLTPKEAPVAAAESKTEKKPTTRAGIADAKSNSAKDVAELSTAAQQGGAAVPVAVQQATNVTPGTEAAPAAVSKPTSEPQEPTAATAVTAPAAASGDLALAMRISPERGIDSTATTAPDLPSAKAVDTVVGASAPSHATTAVSAVAAEPQHKQEANPQSQGGETGGAETHFTPGAPNNASSKETSAAAPTDFAAEFSKAHAEPVKSAHVQISDENNGRVDIRMVEKGGSLSVSVRSSDSTLTKALGDHAVDLTSRLSLDHYKTEAWTPAGNKSSSERQGSPFSGGERNAGSSDQGNAGKRQNSKQNQDPDWVQEFESTPGTFQKRINYTWPQ